MAWVMRGVWDAALRAWAEAEAANANVNARRIPEETRNRICNAEDLIGPSFEWPGDSAIESEFWNKKAGL
jgi:hypothetical protein